MNHSFKSFLEAAQQSAKLPLLCIALIGAPMAVLAHTGEVGHDHGALQAWMQGFVHPFTGWDHLATMLAVGAWSALALRRAWLAPAVFIGALVVGASLGMSGLQLSAVEPMIAASLVVLGLLLASRAPVPLLAGGLIAGVFALFHGAAHGQQLAGLHAGYALLGMVLATALLHLCGMALGYALRSRTAWATRTAGVATAALGMTLLLPAIASAMA